jgi:hypothetical protein
MDKRAVFHDPTSLKSIRDKNNQEQKDGNQQYSTAYGSQPRAVLTVCFGKVVIGGSFPTANRKRSTKKGQNHQRHRAHSMDDSVSPSPSDEHRGYQPSVNVEGRTGTGSGKDAYGKENENPPFGLAYRGGEYDDEAGSGGKQCNKNPAVARGGKDVAMHKSMSVCPTSIRQGDGSLADV